MINAYQNLEEIFKEIGILKSITSLAQWDNDCYMPLDGSFLRQEQMVFLTSQIHQRITNPKIQDLILSAEEEELNGWEQANLRNIKREYIHNNAIDEDLAKQLTKARLVCEINWREARENNDYNNFKKYFKPLLNLIQEVSIRKAEILKLSPYDVLLDVHDEGRKSKEVDIIFADLEKFLLDFTNKIESKNEKNKPFPLAIEKQKQLGLACMQNLSFDLKRGRLDTSTHPFSIGFSTKDVRITARYKQENLLSSLSDILHETGHGIYEQNLPQSFDLQPVGNACGMSIHESQSLFIERHIGLSKEFFIWLKSHLPDNFLVKDILFTHNVYAVR
ncbi:MAG: carboxypeptidase M32, partial [Pseudomonadota bacterium]